jgi:hypothetical protein
LCKIHYHDRLFGPRVCIQTWSAPQKRQEYTAILASANTIFILSFRADVIAIIRTLRRRFMVTNKEVQAKVRQEMEHEKAG